MAFTWALNSRWSDIQINHKGKIATVYGGEEVRQRILVSLRHEWQEYFLNVPGGVPWTELILGSKDQVMVESLIRRAVLEVPGVIGIINLRKSFSTTSNPREFYVGMRVEVKGQYAPSIEDISFSLGV